MIRLWRSQLRQCGKICVKMPRHPKTSRPVNEENQQQRYNPPQSNYWQPHQYDQRSQYAQGQHYYQQYHQSYPVPNGWNAEQGYGPNYGTNWQNDWYGTQYSAQNYPGHANVGPSQYSNQSWGGGYREEQQINGWNGGYYSHDYQPSSYQPKRYEGNRHIHTPVSGRSSRYPSPGKESRRGNRKENEEMRYDHSSDSKWTSRDRFQDPASNPVINEPRKHYLQQTLQGPENYPTDSQTPKPLPLLVLDLNGTLVYRSSRSSGTAAERSKFPTLRPYLACFLRYCLAVDAEHQPDPSISQDVWRKWQEDRTIVKEGETGEDSEMNDDKDARMSESEDVSHPKTHGTHFWPKENSEPKSLPSATYRLLLWSSAQPQNVDHMARAILNPNQAEQLLRVYARDTLVTRKFYSLKSPSVKDLEILWAALNNLTADDESKKRGEERLFAEARDREDRQIQQDEAALGTLHVLWNKKIALPKENENGTYSEGFGYGPHNTLLLDDSVSKARIQPFNHLLVPEFDQERAKVVKRYMKKQSGESGKEEESDKEGEAEEPEDILLQIIGVLEHARYQKNVSSWIRFGGLGNLGNVSEEHPYTEALRKCVEKKVEEDEEKAFKKWETYFSHDLSRTVKDEGPRLQIRVGDRSPTFWVEEGKRALSRKGIEAVI